ncbi:MAG: hypothetical protein H6595_04140 [Flavobacteriales bacterium]|nr:hypothetical protein [Flavobacteriales bacterium]MCB9166649.1 hypothetical protein [Flavobacteriales bacterium]
MNGSIAAVLLAGCLIHCATIAEAQDIDSVFVETYHVAPDPDGGAAPLVTYRIYVDLAAGRTLQMVYGNEDHQLYLKTTTDFFNDKKHGAKIGDHIPADSLNAFPLAIDSWLTLGAASDQDLAVPLRLDPDGSRLTCPPYSGAGVKSDNLGLVPPLPLNRSDGLLRVDSVPPVVGFRMDPGYFGHIRGSVVHTMDGAWAVMGGTKGPTPENIVLIAQVSTTGILSYAFNVQIGLPDGSAVKYVWRDAGDDESYHPDLLHGRVP